VRFPRIREDALYELPKEKLIYGPIAIEAMIDQNTMIAQQLDLWDQKGSRVIRGNLIAVTDRELLSLCGAAVPHGRGHGLPQLKRVIVNFGRQVAMEPTLDEAIQSVFGTQTTARMPRKLPVATGLGPGEGAIR